MRRPLFLIFRVVIILQALRQYQQIHPAVEEFNYLLKNQITKHLSEICTLTIKNRS